MKFVLLSVYSISTPPRLLFCHISRSSLLTYHLLPPLLISLSDLCYLVIHIIHIILRQHLAFPSIFDLLMLGWQRK